MQKTSSGKLTLKMLIAMVAAVFCGVGVIALRENLTASGNAAVWNTINNLLFADISAAGNESAIGLFYIIGQLLVKALQLVIVPMVFTSIVLAMVRISDSRKLPALRQGPGTSSWGRGLPLPLPPAAPRSPRPCPARSFASSARSATK